MIATSLLKIGGGQPWLICAYVVFAGIVSALSAWRIGASRPPAEAAAHDYEPPRVAGVRG